MDLEVKLSQVSSMERELRGLVNELTAKEPNAAQTELQRTKDQLQSLLLEGEQWSKRQMKLEGVLKTLRKEMKAKESEISGLRTDAVTTAQTIQTLTDKCHTQAETEKGLLERIASLTGQFNELKAELERLMRESVLQDKEPLNRLPLLSDWKPN
ncbi:hypothetical protein BVRB_029970 [Beta vulgaris subsp. vulgaris]|uniref:Uncharacterized protein n=1 Tax=Beta vulgaris subsp. vulgaris TaxID=3555 RepID=A0A0J8B123_BETVV|nr:hypothetical protein BVRB_029970 [Beta vulgaris subsp. vulgaris]